MKATTSKAQVKKVFTPFTLNVEVQTEDELRALYLLFNSSHPELKKLIRGARGSEVSAPEKVPVFDSVWEELRKEAIESGLRGRSNGL